MRKLFVVLAAMLILVLISCGGSGGGGSSNTGATPAVGGPDTVFTGGVDVDMPDSNIVFVPFSDTSASQTTTSSTQSVLSTIYHWAIKADLTPVSGALQNLDTRLPPAKWISQYNTDADCFSDTAKKKSKNGYCGFASMLMGATYLQASNLTPPTHYGYGTDGTEGDNVVGTWIKNNVDTAFQTTPSRYASCGGPGLAGNGNYGDFQTFADYLDIDQEEISGITVDDNPNDITAWIAEALNHNYPVMAQVPYQGKTCTGRGADWWDMEGYYNGGDITRDMSYGADCTDAHEVLITEINQNWVKVYDPDPYASQGSSAGIRKYSTSSFLLGLKAKGESNGVPVMLKMMPKGSSKSYAFAMPNNKTELSTNQVYSAANTAPVVTPLVSNATFSATGLPGCLQMEPEGRIVGECSNTGTYSMQVTMTKGGDSTSRPAFAPQPITVVVKDSALIIEDLQFITPSSLNVATVGNNYLQTLGITGTAETPTFILISGSLPPGLNPNIPNGQIIGTPTEAGPYSFVIQVSTSKSNVTKTFNLVVNPASNESASQPVLSGIIPSTVVGMDGQQTVVFTGSGFTDGARVELTDTTNGGTYNKTPVSINSAGTEITISVNFTSNPATWSARVIPSKGNASGTITFSVIAPVSTAPVISSVSPNVLTASTSAQTITITGSNYRTGAVVEITNLATGARTDLSPSTLTSVQIVVNCPFNAATMWSIRVINSDCTSSANTYIKVNAPTSIAVPAIPSLISPGTATAPGTVLSNTEASLSWSSDASASYYAVAVRDLGSGSLVVDTTTSTPSYSLNLLNGEQYRWNAAACNAAGCSSYAAPLYFQTPSSNTNTVDVQPLNVTLGSSSATAGASLLVSWQIRNNGTGTASTSNSQVRITTSNAAGGYGNSSNNVGSAQATGTIAAGATISQSTTVTVPSTPGTYYVWVIADNNSYLSQTNTNNDETICTTALTVTAATVTPSVSSISPTSMTADNLSHTLTIYGSNFASGDTVQFYWGQGSGANVWTISNHTPTVNSSSQITVSMNPGTVTDTIYVRVCSGSNCSSGTQYVSVH